MRGLVTLLGLCLVACEPSSSTGAAPESGDDDVIYRFDGAGGRPSFTNRRDLVPPDAQPGAQAVDLSHVSTNPELGRDIDAAMDRELERLSQSAPCKKAREDVSLGRLGLLWRNERHLVVLGGFLAAFLLVTPWAVRRLGAPWLRVLAFAIPALLLTAVLTHALIHVNRTISAGARLADLCDPVAGQTGGPATPGDVRLRVEHADRLRRAVEAAIVGPEERLREELSH